MTRNEAETHGATCNDCYLAMANCHDMSICCEDETGLCDWFEPTTEFGHKTSDTINRFDAIQAIGEDAMGGLNYEYILERLPSAQPEIIRCKDCKNWDELLNMCGRTGRQALGVNGFCSRAERKSNG